MSAIEPDTSKEQSKRQMRWSKILRLGQEDPATGFSGWLVIFTAFLCLVTGVNVWVLHSTDRTLYEQATAKDRGWVRVELRLTSFPFANVGERISLRLKHENIGASAVSQLTYFYKIAKPITRPNADVEWEAILRDFKPENISCTKYPLPTMLPHSAVQADSNDPNHKEVRRTDVNWVELKDDDIPRQGYVWWGEPNNKELTAEKLKTTFIVYGCSQYRSITAGRTNFCLYLDTKPDSNPGEWEFKECPRGNSLE